MSIKRYLVALILSCSILGAHEDPTDAVDTLTHKILKETDKEKLSNLYLKRAIEYHKLPGQDLLIAKRRFRGVMNDLQKSLELNPQNFEAALYKGQFIEGPIGDELLSSALKLATTDDQKSRAHQALAERFYMRKKIGEAAIHSDQAIAHDKGNDLTLILFKSHLLWKLDKLDERVKFLTNSLGKNASAVLINAWIDAHIDAGKGTVVKKIIAKEMSESRFKSSWLIRSALCEEGPAAKVYAQQAVNEIKTRLNLDRPDVTLLMDLARAYAILSQHDRAEAYANRAKQLAHDEWAMNELEAKIKK